jgi:polysaccharide pyruvyl transferase WcaK-like protein
MKRVFLYGFYGIMNAGNEAMLRALIEPIRNHFNGDVEFVVSNRHPCRDYDREYGVRSVPNLEYSTRDEACGRWLRGLNPDDTPVLIDLLKEISKCDLMIFGPGQYLVETGELGILKGSLAQFYIVQHLCKISGVPFYALAMACEPLRSPWSILTINELLQKVDHLTFRDPQSIENLKSAGIDIPSHYLLGDLALAGEAASQSLVMHIFDKESIPTPDGPRLAVALRSIYWLKKDESVIRQKIADTLSLWLEKYNTGDILMIPQNIYNIDGDRDDDRVYHAYVKSLVPTHLQGRIHEVKGEYSPDQIEALYSSADVTLAARLHGSVFSCKQGTPPVVLAFMDKTIGFFNRLGFPDRMIDLDCSAEDLFAKLVESYDKRDLLTGKILDSVASIRNTARRYSEIAIESLEANRKTNRQVLAHQVLALGEE